MQRARSILLLGGARSGKSRAAERLAVETARPVTYIATAEIHDGEMAERIARHRADRPAHWTTVEEPLEIATCLRTAAAGHVVLVDCLTLWLANIMAAGRDPQREAKALVAAVRASPALLLLVSNETGLGIVPATPLGRAFRDAQGRLNQQMADACEAVIAMMAGLPLRLKPPAEQASIRLG